MFNRLECSKTAGVRVRRLSFSRLKSENNIRVDKQKAVRSRGRVHEEDKSAVVHFPGTLMRMTGGRERLNAR